MFDWLPENATPGKPSSKKSMVFISLWLLSIILLSCDGSGSESDRLGAGADRRQLSIYPPVVFMADKETNNKVELYASFSDGAEIIKLSEELVAGGNVVDFKISPNGFWVAYVADQDTDELFELYVVPVDKLADESAVKVSWDIIDGSGIREITPRSGRYYFAWASNSSRVAYIADAKKDIYELFTATPSGQQKNLISDISEPVESDSDVEDFEWEPRSTLIAYVADQDRDDVIELYTARADGTRRSTGVGRSRTVRVSGKMAGDGIKEYPADSGKYAFAWSPDSTRLAYSADQLITAKYDLFTTTPDGVSSALISRSQEDVRDFKWATNSVRVAYTADDIRQTPRINLYSAAKSGSGSPILHTNITRGKQVSEFEWAPDSSRIVFKSDRDSPFFRLFSVLPSTNTVFQITPGRPTLSDVIEFKWQAKILINSELLIAYRVDGDQLELYTTPPNSANSTQIKPRLAILGGDVFDFAWATDNSRIAYTADFERKGVIELFSSLPNNREPFKVSGEMAAGGNVLAFKWAPDSFGVGYIADQDFDSVNELFASQPNGLNNLLLSGELVVGGDVTRFEWVP